MYLLFLFLTGCVDSRDCVLKIGGGGDTWINNDFFYGQMDNVRHLLTLVIDLSGFLYTHIYYTIIVQLCNFK